MAIIANTFLTFDAIGIREELSDVIYNISPEDTPFLSMSGKEVVRNTLFEWQTDALAAAVTNNVQLEGDDIASFTAVVATTRVGNRTQISRKDLILSGTEEAVDKAGRRSELAYQTAKLGAELKRDMESSMFANNAAVTGNSTTARETAGLGAWVRTNTDFGAGGADPPAPSPTPGTARTDGTQRAFTETILKTVIQETWTTGGTMKWLFVGPFNKRQVSGFAGIVTRNVNQGDRTSQAAIVGAADVYVSDFGFLNVLPSRFQRERDGWVLDPSFTAVSHLRPFQRMQLAKTGDADKRLLIVEYGLKVKNEGALGICADLTAS